MARFSHADFAPTVFAKLREAGIEPTSDIKQRVNTLGWKRGRWTGDKAFDVAVLIEEILRTAAEQQTARVCTATE